MTTPSRSETLSVELERITDRLNSMPLARAESATGPVYEVANLLLAGTRQMTQDVPRQAELPHLGPHALGALIAVLGRDYLDAVAASPSSDTTAVVDALTALRRSLP